MKPNPRRQLTNLFARARKAFWRRPGPCVAMWLLYSIFLTAAPGYALEPATETQPAATPSAVAEGAAGPGALTAFADVDEDMGEVPHKVELDVEVIDGTGTPPFTYIWDFGDATEFSKMKAPSHTYKIPGNFRASVIVTDSAGEIDQDYYDIIVSEPLGENSVTAEELMRALPPDQIPPDVESAIRRELEQRLPTKNE